MRKQGKAILLGGLLVFLGYVLGQASSDGMVYAQMPSSSNEWGGVSVPDGGGAVLFRDGSMGGPMVYFVDSKGRKQVATR